MNILEELEEFIAEFNQKKDVNFEIDSIRIEFSKQHKLEKLKEVGNWKKIKTNSNILHKLKKRLGDDEVTTAFRLDKENIYYYNKRDSSRKYRKAELVVFGMSQYKTTTPPRNLVIKILDVLKDVSNIDLCFDIKHLPNLEALSNRFNLKRYVTKEGMFTNTFYINESDNSMIEKITIYDKAYKNELKGLLYRIEAKVLIPNIKYLALPLNEFKQIIDLVRN